MGVGKTVITNEQALASDINSMAGWGAIGARPNTEDVLAGSFYYDTTNSILYQEQNGSWVAVLQVKTLSAANEVVAAGYYAATTLSAVDADLAVGNIKKGVVIFGFTGTYPTLAVDVTGVDQGTDTQDGSTSVTRHYKTYTVNAATDEDLASITQTYIAESLTIATAFISIWTSHADFKLRLYMDGVQVAESGNLANQTTYRLIGTRATVGVDKICKVAAHNYNAGSQDCSPECEYGGTNLIMAYVSAGSVKPT